MNLTKFTHSCVRLDDGERSLVLDPGVFVEFDAALDGTDAVLITHEHPDHVDVPKLQDAARRNSALRIWAPDSVAPSLGLGDQAVITAPGKSFDAGGFSIRTYGGQHALIHTSIPVVVNVGYLIDDTVYHPGDSLIVPPVEVPLLLAPLHAPWSKAAEVADFIVGVRPRQVRPIHDGLINDIGRGIIESVVGRVVDGHGVDYTSWRPADTVTG